MDNSKVKNDKDGVIQENGTKETPSPIGDSEKPNPDLRDSDDETDGIRGWIVVFASFMVQFIGKAVSIIILQRLPNPMTSTASNLIL